MPNQLTSFQQALIDWFSANQRELPWRRDYIPYQIWISEIMLQQTQMDRAVVYFTRWLEEFPDIRSLARAPEDRVLKMWEGLGYYSRARNIRKCARIIVNEHGGTIPQDPATLRTLPGIGPYTAGAIASIAYNHPAPLVDANVGRIFARLFNIDRPLTQAREQLWHKASELLPRAHARVFNQGLMELGAMICTARTPGCHSCPIAAFCSALRHDMVAFRPIPRTGESLITIEMATGVLRHQGRVFIQQRLADDVWGSLWEFPGGRLEPGEQPEQAVVRELMEETGFAVRIESKITTTIHHYTRYKVILHCFLCSFTTPVAEKPPAPALSAAQQFRWVGFAGLNAYAFPEGHRKLIDFMNMQDI